jgi:hypothetical protein
LWERREELTSALRVRLADLPQPRSADPLPGPAELSVLP